MTLPQNIIDRIEADAAEYARTYTGTKLIKRPHIAGATAEANRAQLLLDALNSIYKDGAGSQSTINLVNKAFASYSVGEPAKEQSNKEDAISFAEWLAENTQIIREEKITLYRYCDKMNEWGNYILEDIYQVYNQ